MADTRHIKSPPRYYSLLIFIFLISIYALSMSSSLTSRNYGEGFMRVFVLENLLSTGHIDVGPSSDKWGIAGRGGRNYIWHEFGQNIFVLPFYALSRKTGYGFFAVNAIATALSCVLIIKLLLRLQYPLKASTLTAFTYGLGTTAWHYASKTPHEHAIAILFILNAVYHAMKYTESFSLKSLIISALSIGLGIITRSDVVLSLLPISLLMLIRREEFSKHGKSIFKEAVIYSLVLIPFLIFPFLYNYYRFGDYFKTGYEQIILAQSGNPKGFMLRYLPVGFLGLFLSPGKSIFLFSPALLLFPLSIMSFKKNISRDAFFTVCSLIAVYTVFYLFYYAWAGDWCYGPRYMLTASLFMILPVVSVYTGWRTFGRFKKAAIIAVLCISLAVQFVSVSSNAWMSNALRYGIDDDGIPYKLNRDYDFGSVGSYKNLKSFFVPEMSQLYLQFKVFSITADNIIDTKNTLFLFQTLQSQAPRPGTGDYILLHAINLYYSLYSTFDVWWLQHSQYAVALMFFALASVCLWTIVRKWECA